MATVNILAVKVGKSIELACLLCRPACIVGQPALLAGLPCWPACLVGLPALLWSSRDGSGLIFLGLGQARVSYFGLGLFWA
jgi:hypothetical protein